MSDWIRDLLWNAGAYVGVAVGAKAIVVGVLRVAPTERAPDPDKRPSLWAGLHWRYWPSDIALGVTAFIWLTPVVLGIHAIFSSVLWDRPHALTALRTAHLSAWEWGFAAFVTCLGAPVIEEILFRGVLLHWLSKTSLLGHAAIVLATLARAAYGIAYHDVAADVDVIDGGPVIFAVFLVSGYVYALYRMNRMLRLAASEVRIWRPTQTRLPAELAFLEHEARREQNWRMMNSMLAVYGSAMLFAILHVDAWPAPIALFVMGLGLGMIARATQSVIGPIIFHAAFNLVAFITLYGTTLSDAAVNGNAQTTAIRPAVADATISSMPTSQLPRRK